MTLAEWFQIEERNGRSPTIWLSNEGGFTTLWLPSLGGCRQKVTIRDDQFGELEEVTDDA